MARAGRTLTPPRGSRRARTESPDRPAVGGLRARNKQEKLDRIQRAARLLFTQKGFDGTTTREIARRARVGTGTLFLYAKDKRELLLQMFQEDCRQATDAAYASIPRGRGLLAEVLHTFECMVDHYFSTPDLARIFLKELLFVGFEDIGAHALEDLRRLAGLVERAQQRGEIRTDVSPMIAATNFFGVYYFVLHTCLGRYLAKSATRDVMRDLLTMQIQGLQPAGAARRTTNREIVRRS